MDMEGGFVMNRLVQGDDWFGKNDCCRVSTFGSR